MKIDNPNKKVILIVSKAGNISNEIKVYEGDTIEIIDSTAELNNSILLSIAFVISSFVGSFSNQMLIILFLTILYVLNSSLIDA